MTEFYSSNPYIANISLAGSCCYPLLGPVDSNFSRFIFQAKVVLFTIVDAPKHAKLLELDVAVIATTPQRVLLVVVGCNHVLRLQTSVDLGDVIACEVLRASLGDLRVCVQIRHDLPLCIYPKPQYIPPLWQLLAATKVERTKAKTITILKN
ncbi:hypothetical protein ACEPPN_001642 [Leptodophora sp. 'Broadleaf-Isolate-01']